MAQKKITDLTLRSDFDGTCNIPIDDAVQTYRTTGSQLLDYIKSLNTTVNAISNLSLETSVASSALTIAVKTRTSANASSSSPITVAMRSSTLTSGVYNNRNITSALSMVVSSGSTLGQTSAQPSIIYVYLIDNGGTLELAVSHTYYPEDALVSTTAEGGAGAADSANAIYSTAARSNVPIRLIGTILNTQTTAGTWASAVTQIQLNPTQAFKAPTIQKFTSGTGSYYTPAGTKYIRVRMVGAGAGGNGGGTAAGAVATGGFNTTFGSSLLSAGGGTADNTGTGWYVAGNGGISSLGTGPIGTAVTGSGGQPGQQNTAFASAGMGGTSALGGAGKGSPSGLAGGAAAANSGSGGGGGGAGSGTGNGGGGGGSGGFVDAIITAPSTTYSYVVGAGGNAGAAGTGGAAGGAGGSGYIEVTEFYQ